MSLLRHTGPDPVERSALTVNPAKTCQPVGAMYAALGIHNCLPHSHGSQGCCSYHRSALTRHYKEPVMASTSSFTEGSAVFGGQANLLQALETIFTTYTPDVVAVHTTCLSETIGDDLTQIVGKACEEGKVPAGKKVLYVNTPSYVGSHVTGFASMVRRMVEQLAVPSERRLRRLNVVPGWVEPSDMLELKRLLGLMGVEHTIFPDTSGILDRPQTGTHVFYGPGGVTIDQLKATGEAMHTLALGPSCSEPAAKALLTGCKVPYDTLELPIGLRGTDAFIDAVRRIAMIDVPASVSLERGKLVDVITDWHQYFHGKRVALFGDPDQLVALAGFLADLDMKPVYIVTGTPCRDLEDRLAKVLNGRVPELKVKQGSCADLYLLHQWIKAEPVDLLIGNTYGKYIARDEDLPFIRYGFPIMDRMGHSYFPSVGYMGAIRLLEQISGALLDHQDRTCPEESFELVQ